MGIYTNSGLVNHAKKALELNTKYMWGGILREITNRYIDLLSGIPEYKSQYPASRVSELRSLVGKNYYGVDCVGLIKSYYWSGNPNGGVGSPKYGASGFPDVNANVMFQSASEKGAIDTMPDIPGLIVYSKSHPHVGIYIGNGYTIESTLGVRGDGVVKRKLDGFWEYWFKCPYIRYESSIPKANLVSSYLDFNATVREAPTINSAQINKLYPKQQVTYIRGSDTIDPSSKLVYVKLSEKLNGKNQWILKQAIHGG